MTETLVLEAHGAVRAGLAAAKSEVRLAAPYMGPGVLARLAHMAEASSASWKALTKLDAASVAHGSLSTQGLRQLLASGVEVRSLTRLHAKLYLGDHSFGLIGSANLTDAGLGGTGGRPNIELGVILDAGQCRAASKHFDDWWGNASLVTEAAISAVEELAKSLPTSVAAVDVEEEAPQLLEDANQLLAEARTANLWIKAVYQDEAAADLAWGDGAWFSSSKRGRPSFQVGDLVLVYAKDAHRCSAVVEVTEAPRHDPAFVVSDGRPEEEGERWPWVNDVQVRLKVPSAVGVPLSHLGFTGQSLQGGHKRLGLSEFALAIRFLASAAQEGGAAA